MTHVCQRCTATTSVPVRCLFTGRTYCADCWVSIRDEQPCLQPILTADGVVTGYRCHQPTGHHGDHTRERWAHSA